MSMLTKSYKNGFIHFDNSERGVSIRASVKLKGCMYNESFRTERAAKKWITQTRYKFYPLLSRN